MSNPKTLEQQARDILEGCGWDDAQSCTAGDVIEVANLLADLRRYKTAGRDIASTLLALSESPDNHALADQLEELASRVLSLGNKGRE